MVAPGTRRPALPALTLAVGAMGVVFGDIGTSPLYTLQACLLALEAPQPADIYGVVSLLVWSLTLVVTVKYVALLMNADNRGEGGIMALLTLLPKHFRATPGGRIHPVSLLVIAGGALLCGDGVITPAISVLSAIEGLTVANEDLQPAVVPVTVAILAGLFAAQRRGTGSLGAWFGPVMLVWFLVTGALGLWSTRHHPAIWGALSPHHAVGWFTAHGARGGLILGSVILAVTGGEALYADMGHFGRRPIRLAWLAVAYPCLILSYVGQGALILAHPEARLRPFFSQVPAGPWTFALVALATLATVIASQGLISAVFSLCYQALRLGFLPRLTVLHTSSTIAGQIYVPAANRALAVSSVALVLVFGASEALAAAFGLAVSGTMAITSIVFFAVARHTWGWPRWKSLAALALLLALDLPFVIATGLKFFAGGYLPVAIGAALFVGMTTHVRGRALLNEAVARRSGELDAFLDRIATEAPRRLPGLAVVMAESRHGTPPVLVQLLDRAQAVHTHVLVLTVVTEDKPWVDPEERLTVTPLGQGLFRVSARYGYREEPVVPSIILHAIREAGLDVAAEDVVYLLDREGIMATDRGRMRGWRESIFAFLSRNAADPTAFFHLPPAQVLEIGSRVDL